MDDDHGGIAGAGGFLVMQARLPLLIDALTALSLLLAPLASAEPRYSRERTLIVPAVLGAWRYEWEVVRVPPDGWHSLTITTDPLIRLRGPWRKVVQVFARPVAFDGTRGAQVLAMGPASWWPDPACDDDHIVAGVEFSCFKAVFGWTNCDGEWHAGMIECP